MSTRRLRRYFRQFRFFTALRFLLADRLRRALDRSAAPSYAQSGEDRVLDALLRGREAGFYVDVGSNDPTKYSNTFRLYKRGWRGIAIDANPALIERHRRVRPRDQAVCAAVSDRVEEAVFTEFDDPAVSSLSAEHVETWARERSVTATRGVTTTTLDRILEDCGAPAAFDLLSVDVERRDLAALRGLDLDRFRPQVIVIEIGGFDLADPQASPVYVHLTARDYVLVGYAVVNAYFRDATDAEAS